MYNHTAVFLNIQKVGDNEIQMYSKYMALDERHIDKYCCLFIIIIIIIIKDLQIHRPQFASTNRSYLQVNYIFLVLPSEIEPSLEDSNRRRLDNFPRKCVPLLDTPEIKGVRLGTSQAVLREDSFQLETVVSARTGTRREPLRDGCLEERTSQGRLSCRRGEDVYTLLPYR